MFLTDLTQDLPVTLDKNTEFQLGKFWSLFEHVRCKTWYCCCHCSNIPRAAAFQTACVFSLLIRYSSHFLSIGRHITIVAHSKAVQTSLEAAEELEKEDIECEVASLSYPFCKAITQRLTFVSSIFADIIPYKFGIVRVFVYCSKISETCWMKGFEIIHSWQYCQQYSYFLLF